MVVAELIQPIFIGHADFELPFLTPVIPDIQNNFRTSKSFAFCLVAKAIFTFGPSIHEEAVKLECRSANLERKRPVCFNPESRIEVVLRMRNAILVPLLRVVERHVEDTNRHVKIDLRTYNQQSLFRTEEVVLGVKVTTSNKLNIPD